MMISERLATMLAEQVGHELAASHKYLAAAVYFGQNDLDGWQEFFLHQSEEEREHALKIVKFLTEVGAPVVVPAIGAFDPGSIESPLDACKKALKGEQFVTQCFRDMWKAAHEEGDAVTGQFLDWFIEEQVEEEGMAQRLISMLESGLNPHLAQTMLSHEHDD